MTFDTRRNYTLQVDSHHHLDPIPPFPLSCTTSHILTLAITFFAFCSRSLIRGQQAVHPFYEKNKRNIPF
jgi:hypothetical protein